MTCPGSLRKRNSVFIPCLLIVLCAGQAQATITMDPWSPMFYGVDFTSGRADASEVRLQKVFALRVDLTTPGLEFFSTPSNGDAERETFGQTTTTFVETYGVQVGINANFFSPVNTTPNDPRDLSGLAMSRGTIVSPFESGRPAMLITRSNAISFRSTAPPNPSLYWTAVAGSDRVVRYGTNTVSPDCVTSFCGPNPRTAVGVSQDGRYLYLIVIDGRQPGWSDGATLLETGDWLRRFGVWEGLNLDGGGSTAMARLTNGAAVLLNRPSGGVQRVNGNHIGVFAQALVPIIVAHPAPQTVSAWQPATFSVKASGPRPLSYQWRLNASAVPSATNSSYSIPASQAEHAGVYSVVVSNGFGSVTSSNALLTVIPLPSSVLSAGDNTSGQLNAPPHASNLVAVAAGNWHSLALHRDGRIFAWGGNLDSQCDVPVELTNAVAVAAGGYHSLALDADCRVRAWGANDVGQCSVPAHLTNLWAVSAGSWHSLGLQRDGKVAAWGDNTSGQAAVPAGLSNVIGIAAGAKHSLVLKADGTVVAWGYNFNANAVYVGQAQVPIGLAGVVAIAAGGWHSLALKNDGSLAAWGDYSFGQTAIPAHATNIAGIAAGGYHSLGLRRDGRVIAWGNNLQNQCALNPAITNFAAIAAGQYHSLALLDEETGPVRLLKPLKLGSTFSVLLQSRVRSKYQLDVFHDLNAPPLSTASMDGNGALLLLNDPAATNASRFYRAIRE